MLNDIVRNETGERLPHAGDGSQLPAPSGSGQHMHTVNADDDRISPARTAPEAVAGAGTGSTPLPEEGDADLGEPGLPLRDHTNTPLERAPKERVALISKRSSSN